MSLATPPDVVTNGCPWCRGPALFVHGDYGGVRVCDRCDTLWTAEVLAECVTEALVNLVASGRPTPERRWRGDYADMPDTRAPRDGRRRSGGDDGR